MLATFQHGPARDFRVPDAAVMLAALLSLRQIAPAPRPRDRALMVPGRGAQRGVGGPPLDCRCFPGQWRHCATTRVVSCGGWRCGESVRETPPHLMSAVQGATGTVRQQDLRGAEQISDSTDILLDRYRTRRSNCLTWNAARVE